MQLTERPIAIFDLDGVIIRNPDEALVGSAITDKHFWSRHWMSPNLEAIQHEVVSMMHALSNIGYHLVVLTARPTLFEQETVALLQHVKFNPFVWHGDTKHASFEQAFAPSEFIFNNITLKMLNVDEVPEHSGNWKSGVVQSMLEHGLNVQFMMEDHKPNADAVRKLIPVFLYERKK